MSEVPLGYFGNRIREIEHEVKLWEELHTKLKNLIEAKGKFEDDFEYPEDCYWEYESDSFSTDFGEWHVDALAGPGANQPRLTNRWGQELTDVISVNLWVSVNGEGSFVDAFSDDAKLELFCSPMGILDGSHEHLSADDIRALLKDPMLFG